LSSLVGSICPIDNIAGNNFI